MNWGTHSFCFSPSSKEEKIKSWLSNSYLMNVNGYHHCFGWYFESEVFKYDMEFAFSFPAIPIFYRRIINKFNRKFKNIQYEVLAEKDVYIYYHKRDFEDDSNFYLSTISNASPIYSGKQALITINFNGSYTENAKYYLKYFLHHFLRMVSIGEGFIEVLSPEMVIKEHPKKYDSLQYVLDINNNHQGYRSLVDGEVKLNQFMLLDNVDLINHTFSDYKKKDIRQTEILSTIVINSGIKYDSVYKVNDKIKGVGEMYTITNDWLKEGIVVETYPFNKVRITILEHIDKTRIGRTVTVDTRSIEKI